MWTPTSHLLKKFLQQNSFQDSILSVWVLNLALKSSFLQQDLLLSLLFKDKRRKKKPPHTARMDVLRFTS